MKFHDAEGWERRRDRHDARIAEFVAGQIGEATLRVSLEILGFRGCDLRDEIDLAKRLKQEKRR